MRTINKKRLFTTGVVFVMLVLCLSGCGAEPVPEAAESFEVGKMNQALLSATNTLPRSEKLYFENGLEITGLGVTYDGRPTEFDGCYYFPAIEAMTGVHVAIDWQEDAGYSSAVAEHMDAWRSPDGHIYTIPSVSTIRGSFSMMVRQDWLKALNLDTPRTWEDWLTYWRGVRDNDLNGNGDPSDEIPIALSESSDGERSLTLLMNAFGIAASNDTQFCLLDDGTYTMVYEHPRYPEYLKTMAELYKEGILVEGYETFSYASIEQSMGNNTLGSTMTFAASGAQTAALREGGVKDALWMCVEPVAGSYGDRMIQERELISPMWCITAGAYEKGKAEDIVRFFNWCYSEEGAGLYNYGIEGISYILRDEKPILDKALVANGFSDYRAVGINYEPFGGYWLQDAYMQCLFAGENKENLTDIQAQTYNGLFIVNNDYFYTQPLTIETQSYVMNRTTLITDGICNLRDQAIRGEISQEEFWSGYRKLKEKGLEKVISDGKEYYRNMLSGGAEK